MIQDATSEIERQKTVLTTAARDRMERLMDESIRELAAVNSGDNKNEKAGTVSGKARQRLALFEKTGEVLNVKSDGTKLHKINAYLEDIKKAAKPADNRPTSKTMQIVVPVIMGVIVLGALIFLYRR